MLISKKILFVCMTFLMVNSITGRAVVYAHMDLESQIKTAEYIVQAQLKSKQAEEHASEFKAYRFENDQKIEFDVETTAISTFFTFKLLKF